VQDRQEPTLDELAERSFGLAMRAARNRLHLSQTALAQELERRHRIKLDGTAITRIERRIHGNEGARVIRLGEAVAIASILGLSLDELVEPGLDQQLRDARLRVDAAERQVREAELLVAQARAHAEELERLAGQHHRQVELEAELSLLQDEMDTLREEMTRKRLAHDHDGMTELAERLLDLTDEENRLTDALSQLR
jgi:hypothetical protein